MGHSSWCRGGRVELGGPDRVVGGDEEYVSPGPAEGEVHGAREVDLAEEAAELVEHLHAADEDE